MRGIKYTLLGEIKVSTESPGQRPTLERLIVLALSVSSYQPQYGLLVAQSHWYASTIWKLLTAAFPDTVKFDGNLSGAGKDTPAPMTQPYATLAAKYLESWGEFEQKIPSLQAKYGTKRHEEETKRLKEENKRLEEESKRFKEETRRIKEWSKRLQEETKRLQEESKRLKEIIAELQAKNTAV
ncbi:hypothetical protein RSOLAG22IIIB_03283 [Rhizoctonia solani]|uniref:Uncharacterized protein n=1 Tax=Rhizoctonia solani TaxID=456999 RepID=A0A0K6FP41_9AGAM|nr:hypothetical protein RSOLAG22IIIB_03283 [Rhizoctonia solani]